MDQVSAHDLQGVAETLLLPLYYRATESQRPDRLIVDDKAVELMQRLDYDFSRFARLQQERLATLVRIRVFDRCTQDFLARTPDGIVINLGCGLDTRFYRIDNGTADWYDLDLPEVIALRRDLLGEPTRCHLIAASAFDFTWMNHITVEPGRAVLISTEGVLPYFNEDDVRCLILNLMQCFLGAELIFDALAPILVRIHNLEFAMTKVQARLKWGLRNGGELEKWQPGIQVLHEWFYFDQPEAQGAFRLMRLLPPLAKSARIVHCRLGTATRQA
jgi:O-methyltransferase involved in polyketide biosynthesis